VDTTAVAPEQAPSRVAVAGPLDRLARVAGGWGQAFGRRIRVLDPITAVGWLLAVGLALLVAYVLLATPLVPTLRSDTFRVPWTLERLFGTPVSSGRLRDWIALARPAGVSVVVGVLVARRWVTVGTALAAWPFVAIPLFGTFAWGWWLALAAVAVVAAFTRPVRALVPYLLSVAVIVADVAKELTTFLPTGEGSPTALSQGGWWAVFGYSAYSGAAIAVSAALGAGLRSRARTAAARATERRALEVESSSAARAALARDLHDVVAHHVSLVAVRAESAPYSYPDLGEDARRVLADIATDARSALTELRRVLAILRRAEDAPLGPQPGADDVAALVAEARAAGQAVKQAGEWSDVPAGHGYVLYRAVQEGLTNARRHAPGAAVTLTLREGDGVVGFRMANATRVTGPVEPGRGLLGMRERVEALGGAVSAEVDAGTFVLVATLPPDPP